MSSTVITYAVVFVLAVVVLKVASSVMKAVLFIVSALVLWFAIGWGAAWLGAVSHSSFLSGLGETMFSLFGLGTRTVTY
jgi:hypothetical protein